MHIDGAAFDPALVNIYVPLDIIGVVHTYRSLAAMVHSSTTAKRRQLPHTPACDAGQMGTWMRYLRRVNT